MSLEFRQPFESYTVACPTGDGTEPVFEYDENDVLICTGRTDVDAIIQSHKDECDISSILSRALNGDDSGLQARIGQYIDAVDLPGDLREAFDAGSVGAAAYQALSAEQKDLLKNGKMDEFVASFVEQSGEEKKPVDEKADLEARLKSITGKEVKYE